MCAEERHVARLGEDHPVGRERPFGVHDRDSNVALEHAAVCDDEALSALALDAELLQYGSCNPGELAACVDEYVVDAQPFASVCWMLDGDVDSNAAHVRHASLALRTVPSVIRGAHLLRRSADNLTAA